MPKTKCPSLKINRRYFIIKVCMCACVMEEEIQLFLVVDKIY